MSGWTTVCQALYMVVSSVCICVYVCVFIRVYIFMHVYIYVFVGTFVSLPRCGWCVQGEKTNAPCLSLKR